MNESLQTQIQEFRKDFFDNFTTNLPEFTFTDDEKLIIQYNVEDDFICRKSIDNFLDEFEKEYKFDIIEWKRQDYEDSKKKWTNMYYYVELANIEKKQIQEMNTVIGNTANLVEQVSLPIYPSFLIINIKPFTYLVKVINKDILKDGDAVLYKTIKNYYRLVQLSNEFHNSDFKERNEFYTFIDKESYNENNYQVVNYITTDFSKLINPRIFNNKGDEIILVQFKDTPNKENITFPYKDNSGQYNLIITERTGNKFSIGKFYENSKENEYGHILIVVDRNRNVKPLVPSSWTEKGPREKFYYTFIYAKDYDPDKYKIVTTLE